MPEHGSRMVPLWQDVSLYVYNCFYITKQTFNSCPTYTGVYSISSLVQCFRSLVNLRVTLHYNNDFYSVISKFFLRGLSLETNVSKNYKSKIHNRNVSSEAYRGFIRIIILLIYCPLSITRTEHRGL